MPSSEKTVVFSINSAEADGIIYLCMLHYKKAFALVIWRTVNATNQFRISQGKKFL